MAAHDFSSNVKIVPAILHQTATPVTSRVIDLKGSNGVSFAINYGAIAATGTTVAAKLQHSDQLATGFVDLPASEYGSPAAKAVPLPGARVSGANQVVVKQLAYKGIKRYIRLVVTPSVTGVPVSAVALLNPSLRPPA